MNRNIILKKERMNRQERLIKNMKTLLDPYFLLDTVKFHPIFRIENFFKQVVLVELLTSKAPELWDSAFEYHARKFVKRSCMLGIWGDDQEYWQKVVDNRHKLRKHWLHVKFE